MATKNEINPIQAYCEGQYRAAFASCMNCVAISEKQIDAVKEYTSKAKESIIEQSTLSTQEEEEKKRQWKQWLDEYTQGVKDELRREGKLLP